MPLLVSDCVVNIVLGRASAEALLWPRVSSHGHGLVSSYHALEHPRKPPEHAGMVHGSSHHAERVRLWYTLVGNCRAEAHHWPVIQGRSGCRCCCERDG
jgi:hypothetical protein